MSNQALERRVKITLQNDGYCEIAGAEFPVDDLFEIVGTREVYGNEHISQYAHLEPYNFNGWEDNDGRVEGVAVVRNKEDGSVFGMIFTAATHYITESVPRNATSLEAQNA